MKKGETSQSVGSQSGGDPADVLANIEKAASAVVQHAKRIRAAENRGGDAITAHSAIKDLREHLAVLGKLSEDVLSQELSYADRADKQFLELESAIRESCARRGWRVDGQWPTLYVERAIAVEVSEGKRSIMIAGKKLPAGTAEAAVAYLEPLVRELLPRAFSPRDFMRDVAAAYDDTPGGSAQLPIFDLYRVLVVHAQGTRFWRDARTEGFTGLSADQFRARLSATLEGGVTSAPDGREIRLLPPLNPKDGLFMYQPSESRYGFVGRVEFVRAARSEAQ